MNWRSMELQKVAGLLILVFGVHSCMECNCLKHGAAADGPAARAATSEGSESDSVSNISDHLARLGCAVVQVGEDGSLLVRILF